jgi:small subunit ribosomal protein S2
MKELLECGVHFGHQTRRWNPKMAEYIFAERNGIYIIDLQKTLRMLETAVAYVQDVAAKGGTILFVGTKRQSQEAVRAEAIRCSMYHVNHRWLGGMLTNFQTIRRSINRLDKLDADETSGLFEQMPKKRGHISATRKGQTRQ